MSTTHLGSGWAILLSMLLLPGLPAAAVDARGAEEERSDEARMDAERAEILQQMQSLAEAIRVTRAREPAQNVPLIGKPLFLHTSPTRDFPDGSTWGWGAPGRPLAFVKLLSRNEARSQWTYCCASTSLEPIELFRGAERPWYPQEGMITFRRFPDARAPADSSASRLRQMKQLARRFSAHEFWLPGRTRYELNVKVQPVHRYEDAERGIVDGCVFIIAHEVEPEIILLIEAIDEGGTNWQFGAMGIGAAEFHLELDRKQVYTRPWASGNAGLPTETYFGFTREIADPTE